MTLGVESEATTVSAAEDHSGDLANRRSEALASLALIAAVGVFAFISRKVATGESERVDQTVREHVKDIHAPVLDVAVKPVTLLSMPIIVVTATAALALWLRRSGRREASLAVALSPILAATAGQSFTTFLSQRNPPDKHDAPAGEVLEPSFPSGHTTGVTAEALTIAFVLANEELLSPKLFALLLAWPLLVGTSRVYRDRHWAADVVGGWVAGTGVSALLALIYDAMRRSSLANT